MIKTAKQSHDEKVRQDLFNVTSTFFVLILGRGPVAGASSNAMMKNIDELCCFTPGESDQARDYIFNSSDDGTIPECVKREVAKCGDKLSRLFHHFTGDREDYAAMWEALYDLFEIDSLWEAAKENGAGREE